MMTLRRYRDALLQNCSPERWSISRSSRRFLLPLSLAVNFQHVQALRVRMNNSTAIEQVTSEVNWLDAHGA